VKKSQGSQSLARAAPGAAAGGKQKSGGGGDKGDHHQTDGERIEEGGKRVKSDRERSPHTAQGYTRQVTTARPTGAPGQGIGGQTLYNGVVVQGQRGREQMAVGGVFMVVQRGRRAAQRAPPLPRGGGSQSSQGLVSACGGRGRRMHSPPPAHQHARARSRAAATQKISDQPRERERDCV
jgi:hypothetical protein